MSLSPNELVATNASSAAVSCTIANADGCNLSVASGGGTLNAAMAQDLSPAGNPQFTNITPTGQLDASNTTNSTSTSSGALVTAGGMGIAKNTTVGGQINSTDTTNSTSPTTGAIVTPGGMGIAKTIYCGGGINFGGSTLSSFGTPQSWTPSLLINLNPSGFTYSNQWGTVCYFGNLVMCSFGMNLTSKGTNTGGIGLSLPVTISGGTQPTINVGAWGLVGIPTGMTQMSLQPTYSRAALFTLSNPSGGNIVYLADNHLTNSSGIWGNIWYFI